MDKITLTDKQVEILREMVKVQGRNGNFDYDPYFHGMYNGMEFMLAIIEDREPVYKSAPAQWLRDIHQGQSEPGTGVLAQASIS